MLDFTLVSSNLGSKCNWEVWGKSSIGSDHPVVTMLDIETDRMLVQGRGRWVFEKANWAKFGEICEERMVAIDSNQEIDILNEKVCAIIEAASESIPKSKGKMTRKAVPWWTDKCSKAV